MPSERDRSVTTAATDGSTLIYIYRVPNLDASCYGPVTAMEYCYRYSTSAGAGSTATFNWTVLILEENGRNRFMIDSSYVIQSHGSIGDEKCTSNGGQVTCCDTTNVTRFDLPVNFAFGVTESAQENTHNAELQRFADAFSQYRVGTLQVSKVDQTLSAGSTIMPSTPEAQIGLHLLWFVIGKHQ